jgi:hypothetical protein
MQSRPKNYDNFNIYFNKASRVETLVFIDVLVMIRSWEIFIKIFAVENPEAF